METVIAIGIVVVLAISYGMVFVANKKTPHPEGCVPSRECDHCMWNPNHTK